MLDSTRSATQSSSRTEGAHQDSGYLPCGCHEPPFRWYVVRTGAGQEILALQSLRAAGFPAWLPQIATAERIMAAFPSYLFVEFDLGTDAWRSIYRTRGVDTILGMTPGRPDPVPDLALKLLWSRCAPNGVFYPGDRAARAKLKRGQTVRVTHGPLAEMTGIVTASGRRRVEVLMSILGREAQVALPADAVAAA